MARELRHVLITGASSGIGYASVASFVARGYGVFGTVRTTEDASRLKGRFGERFQPLIADVSDSSTVSRAVALAKEGLRGQPLAALINNAGIALPGPLVDQPFDDIRKMFEVNFFGLVAMTRACLPLLGMGKERPAMPGKVINISSGAGKLSIPFLAGYTASKHAVEGMSHSLRRELLPWNIPVVVVGPGNVRTPIWTKASNESAWDHTAFSKVYRNFLRFMFEGEKKGMEPSEIGELLVKIVETRKPKARYAPVAQKLVNWTIPRLLSDEQLDRAMFKALGMEGRG